MMLCASKGESDNHLFIYLLHIYIVILSVRTLNVRFIPRNYLNQRMKTMGVFSISLIGVFPNSLLLLCNRWCIISMECYDVLCGIIWLHNVDCVRLIKGLKCSLFSTCDCSFVAACVFFAQYIRRFEDLDVARMCMCEDESKLGVWIHWLRQQKNGIK